MLLTAPSLRPLCVRGAQGCREAWAGLLLTTFLPENVVLPDPASYISCSAIPPFCFAPQADIILWDFPKQELLARLSLHEGKVEGLSFSPRGIYLVSLGGQDDGR